SGGGGINQLTQDVLAGPGVGSQAATVVGFQTVPVYSTAPTTNQIMQYDGTAWGPQTFAGITGSGVLNTIPIWTGASSQSISNLTESSGALNIGDATVNLCPTCLSGVVTTTQSATISTPASSLFSFGIDSGTSLFACKNSSGASCMPPS